MKKISRRSFLQSVAATGVVAGLTACGDTTSASTSTAGSTATSTAGSTAGDDSADTGAVKEPIHMQLCYWDADTPTGDELIYTTIMEKIGYSLDVDWVPPAAMTEKTTTTLAGGMLPEVLMIINPDMRTQMVTDCMTGGMFWEIGDMLKDYPNLSTIPSSVINAMRYDGKVYSLPRMTVPRSTALLMREDWLDDAGLPSPRTKEEYYEAFKAFTKREPGADGKQKLAISMFGGATVKALCIACGAAPNIYADENNEIKAMHQNPHYVDYLDFMRGMYEEGFINKDFAAAKMANANEQFFAEESGTIADSVGKLVVNSWGASLYQNNPDARVRCVEAPINPDGDACCITPAGFYGYYAISKQTVKDEARLREILNFFDKMMDPEIVDLYVKGIEGVHYEMKDGKFTKIGDDLLTDNKGTGSFAITSTTVATLQTGAEDHFLEYYDMMNDTTLKEYPELNDWFTKSQYAAPTANIIEDAATKYVMGEIEVADLETANKKWEDAGGLKMMEDYTAQYAKIVAQL